VVYDENIPENERCIFTVPDYVTIVSFDGEQVKWKPKADVTIPAGEHHIKFSYYESSTYRTSESSGELTFNFISNRKYELVTEDAGYYLNYWIDYTGIMPLAVPNTNETLILFNKTGFGDYPTYVHIQGEDSKITFYLPRGKTMRFIIPKGSYTLYGSKSRRGKTGKTLEINAQSEDIAIDVIGPNMFTQPGFKLKYPVGASPDVPE
jgi:hypothetical protein